MALCLILNVTVSDTYTHTPFYSCIDQSKCPHKVG